MTLHRKRRSEKMVANLRWIALVAAALLLEDRATATVFVIGAAFVFAYNLLMSVICSSENTFARTQPWAGHVARLFDIIVITAAVPVFSNAWGNFRLLYVPVIIGAGMVEGGATAFLVALISMGASAGVGRLLPGAVSEWAAYDVLANVLLFSLASVFGGYLSSEADREESNRLNVRRLAIFGDMGAALSNPSNIDHIAHLLASVAVELTGIRRCIVMIHNPKTGIREVRSIRGYRSQEIDDMGLPADFHRGNRTGVIHDIPMIAQSEMLGSLHLTPYGKEERASDEEISFLTTLATQAATAVRNARLADEVQRRAETDTLTGLANRWTLNAKVDSELKRACRYDQKVSVCLCDLDNFKQINDTRGHITADRTLAALGTALIDTIRPGDIAARFGGDELLVLLANADTDQACAAADRIRKITQQISNDVLGEDAPVRLGISIGVASYPTDGEDFETLVRRADDRLLQAKALGKDRTVTGLESEAA